jgi:hypothetical protein
MRPSSLKNIGAPRAAEAYRALGSRVVPLHIGTKIPAVKWKTGDIESPYTELFAGECNLAAVTGAKPRGSGIVVIDCDDAAAMRHVEAYCALTPMQARSPRGGRHYYYRAPATVVVRNRVDVGNMNLDVRGDGGLIVLPPSWSREHNARWRWLGQAIAPELLPVFDPVWLPKLPDDHLLTPAVALRSKALNRSNCIAEAERQLSSIWSIAGNGGDRSLFVAACTLIQRHGLTYDEALPILERFNESNCLPPWPHTRLVYKLREAIRLNRIPHT